MGVSVFNGALYTDGVYNTTLISSLYISGFTTLNNISTCGSSLNVSGNTLLNNITTCNSSLTVNGNTLLNNITTINSSLYVSGLTIFNNASFIFMGIRILPGTPLAQLASQEGLIKPAQDLLEPAYYIAPGLDAKWLEDTLTAGFKGIRNGAPP